MGIYEKIFNEYGFIFVYDNASPLFILSDYLEKIFKEEV